MVRLKRHGSPGLDAAGERPDAREAFPAEPPRGLNTGCVLRAGTVQDDIAVAWKILVPGEHIVE
jgi:hypothetical protein